MSLWSAGLRPEVKCPLPDVSVVRNNSQSVRVLLLIRATDRILASVSPSSRSRSHSLRHVTPMPSPNAQRYAF